MAYLDKALDIIKRCCKENGMIASPDRYNGQFWTRDFMIAGLRSLLLIDPDTAVRYVHNIVEHQGGHGKIPIIWVDDEKAFVASKKPGSFMLQQYQTWGLAGLANLTPHTRDSELLFMLGCTVLPHDSVLDGAVRKARDYILEHPVRLVYGADWRDTRLDLNRKAVLSNACVLAYVCPVVRPVVQQRYYNGRFFVDYPDCDTFDLFGNALAILFGIATDEQCESIWKYAEEKYLTPYGFSVAGTFLPARNEREREIMRRDGAVIWPFVSHYMLLSMLHRGDEKRRDRAKEIFKALPEQFYECHSPLDNEGYGSTEQMWSACMYHQVAVTIASGGNLPACLKY